MRYDWLILAIYAVAALAMLKAVLYGQALILEILK